MPIPVTCSCGKMFKVKDELIGQQVNCQVCGAAVNVPYPGQTAPEAPAPATPMEPTPARETVACPSCAEPISPNAIHCPFCKEPVSRVLSPEQQRTRLAELLSSVQAHDDQAVANDAVQRGRSFSGMAIAMGVLTALSLFLIILGAAIKDGEPALVMGIIMGLIFGIAFLVSFTRDRKANHIADAGSAAAALHRYLMATQTGRQKKAYYALVPCARMDAPVQTPTFKKIPSLTGPTCVDDEKSFELYLKTIFAGGSSHNRTVQFKKTRLVGEHDAFAVVEVEANFSSYPSWLLLTILLNVLICVLLIVAFTKRETRKIRKLLIKHNGRWYIADPGFEGAIDRVAAEAAATF